MKRNFRNVLCLILTLIFTTQFFCLPAKAEGENKDDKGIVVEAKSALLMEPSTGKIIYEKNSHERFAPASVTKIMTMLLAMEAIDSGKIKLQDKITVSENSKKMGGSSMILETGEIRTVEEILKGIAIASGNDAAVAMAEYLGGSEGAFVNMMNERAKSLNMKDTAFKNCTGLSAVGHFTTAYDISIMSRALLKHPKILKYSGTYMETISEGRKSPIGLVNHNKLVRFFAGCDGLKTGFTNEAMYCMSATATRSNVRMLAIIMGAPTYTKRNRDASMLMNYGFTKFETKKVIAKDQGLEKVILNKKGDKFLIAKAHKDFLITLEKGNKNKITKKFVMKEGLKEYKKDVAIGFCEIYVDNKLSGKIVIYSDRDIKKSRVWDNIKNNFTDLFDKAI
ncbi:D-alanyl-D-alanine carboxypeptidase [Clostridium sp. CM028]|uniref:D-alanyl-D-alanine carboxypeptidase family protein n=1 Tax=unclassified Clostridium TaxID=2614128 RepID=UPI001C0BEDFE|nr:MULTISPECIES: D-alanyl-D-alanine carboxypeptidase family protein [unclassified Clostridium]MBU3091569.1 D-alanyl-D-alanine carboxypeptidase [Clostridium sp. CF011]MBW9144166.1 D-alanyl-D-alanine carboxypeptidase [Clostridium sp. CM027]MBW9147523.1 D-alanyl-D-alanine carboxypeptidase [Clostridium sp. CM028]UVE41191.1 D-alanyl-D-alanine carboxypeptidase [Clostridium sp. CM027]WAG70187.1 D-alanyl-D-alanine carboxypeptidase [Clostridium sp. CF011]